MKAKQSFGLLASVAAMFLLVLSAVAPVRAANNTSEVDPALRQSLRATRLAEPLVATRPTTSDEDRALLQALQAFRQRATPDDIGSLTRFLSAHPRSGWAPALLTNLGLT